MFNSLSRASACFPTLFNIKAKIKHLSSVFLAFFLFPQPIVILAFRSEETEEEREGEREQLRREAICAIYRRIYLFQETPASCCESRLILINLRAGCTDANVQSAAWDSRCWPRAYTLAVSTDPKQFVTAARP